MGLWSYRLGMNGSWDPFDYQYVIVEHLLSLVSCGDIAD